MQFMDTILKDLRTIISTIVIKYEDEAKQNETLETRREADLYMSAIQGIDTFNTYQTFVKDAFINAGISSLEDIERYQADKYLIPRDKREAIVAQQRRYIIQNYVEQNNYYRMLSGLPDLNSLDYVYLSPEISDELNLDPNTPIHEFGNDIVVLLRTRGYLAQIQAANPTRKYLNFLGDSRIPIVQARNAQLFSILRMTKDIPENFSDEFNTTYDQSREYFLSVIYNKNLSKSYNHYSNFIAMMIMVMTIQRIITNTLKYGIEYDFYDLASIKMVFDAYNVPFMEKVPIDYQRILVRNLNNMLRFKNTDRVLYDICSLLGLDNVKIFKYFIFKEHRFDETNSPIFAYKEIDDGNGNMIKVEDHETMYRLFFQAVELNERNLALGLSETANMLDYTHVVTEDPYWWDEDDELLKKIYESEINFAESKYLSMNIMYKLTEMLFEISYFFNMLLDRKNSVSKLSIRFPKLFEDKDVSYFNMVAFLCALICKKNKMKGNIIHTPSKILTVMGFNFKADLAAIRAEIQRNPALDDSIIPYVNRIGLYTATDINKMYTNIRDLNDFLVEAMASTQDIDTYRAYKKLYETLMVTQHMDTLFEKSDGTIAETFLEYLWDRDPVLAGFVENADVDLIGEYIEHILFRLNAQISDLKYLNIINDANSLLLNAAITLIRFFKSYSTDLTSLNIVYLMDSRYLNMLKSLHQIRSLHAEMRLNGGDLVVGYGDHLERLNVKFTNEDLLNLREYSFISSHYSRHEQADMTDEMKQIISRFLLKTKPKLRDRYDLAVHAALASYLTTDEQARVIAHLVKSDRQYLTDLLTYNVNLQEEIQALLTDEYHSVVGKMDLNTVAEVVDLIHLRESIHVETTAKIQDAITRHSQILVADYQNILYTTQITDIQKTRSVQDRVNWTEQLRIEREL